VFYDVLNGGGDGLVDSDLISETMCGMCDEHDGIKTPR
jgi:hypothetical protein